MWVYLLAFATFLCVLHILLNYNERARMIKKLPGPKDDFIIGNGLRIIRSPVELMKMGREYAKKWNGIYRVWVYPFAAVIIYNPEDIEGFTRGWAAAFSEYLTNQLRLPIRLPSVAIMAYPPLIWGRPMSSSGRLSAEMMMLIMSSMKYGEKSLIYMILKPWLRDGLLLSNGAKWQERRKILTPAFHFNILRQFCVIIEENTQRLLERLKQTTGQPIDVVPVLSEYTLSSICETAMGTQLSEDATGTVKSYKQAVYDLGSLFYKRFIRVYLYPDFIFNATSLGRKQNRIIKTVQSFTSKVIKQRKDYVDKYGIQIIDESTENDELYVYKKKKKTAMLDLLLSAEKEGLIDKAGIQEEVDTFMFEGHDTTASGLTFFFMLLANHKNVQDNIVTELKEIFGDSSRGVCMEDLPKMKYLERCIKESLRLYPPVHFISRKLNETTVLSNYTIPPGSLCHIPIYDLHHREDLFENAEEFNPDRFLPENSEGRHPYAYIPFSAGPRNCIGQKFAMMEMKIAVAEVLREFELKPVTRQSDIEFLADLVLRNNGPVRVLFLKRHQ